MSTGLFDPLPQADVGHQATANSHWVRLITDFYKIHNPAKVDDVPAILREYEGMESELFQNLVTKYGHVARTDPAAATTTARQPSSTVDATVSEFTAGSAAPQQTVLSVSTATSQAAQPHPHPQQAHSAPPQAHPSAPTATPKPSFASTRHSSVFSEGSQRVAGTALLSGSRSSVLLPPVLSDGLQQRVARLRRTHPEAVESDLVVTAVHQQRVWRNAIIAFYQKHQPDKLANIHEIFSECNGEEEMLYEILEAKYLHGASYRHASATAATSSTTSQSMQASVQSTTSRGSQCDARRGITVSTAPLTQSMEVTGGELIALEDVGDQIEWSLLVMLEQEERVRRLMSGLLVESDRSSEVVAAVCKASSDRLDGIHTDAMALRLIFDKHFSDTCTEVPSLDVVAPNITLPTPIALDGLALRIEDDASPPVSPPAYPHPQRGNTVASSASLSTGRMSPPAPLPAQVAVSTAALMEAVASLKQKGINLPSELNIAGA